MPISGTIWKDFLHRGALHALLRGERRKGYAMELTGKVALVTGAGSGIGKVTTVLLAKQGARVAALSHTADEIQATAEEIQRGGGEAMAVVADISQEEQMQRAVQQVVDR